MLQICAPTTRHQRRYEQPTAAKPGARGCYFGPMAAGRGRSAPRRSPRRGSSPPRQHGASFRPPDQNFALPRKIRPHITPTPGALSLAPHEVDAIFATADVDNNGTIDWQEFAEAFREALQESPFRQGDVWKGG